MSEVTHGARARRLLEHTAVLAAAQAVVRIAGLVAFPLLTWAVEPKTFGLYTYALQIAAAWAVLANFQLKAPLLRAVTADEDPAAAIGQVLALRLLLALLVAAGTAVWCAAKFATPRERWIFELLLAAALLQQLAATFDEALQAREAFRSSAAAAVVQGLLVSGGIILGVQLGRPIVWAVGAQMVGALVWLLLCWRLAERTYGQPLRRAVWSTVRARAMLTLALGVAVSAQLGAWYGRADLIAVERLRGQHELGVYAVPYRALDVVMAGTMVLHTALLPMLARAQAAGPEALLPRLHTVLRFGLLLWLPVGLLISGAAPWIVRLFRPDYAAASAPLALLIWVAPLVFCGAVLHWVLIFAGRPWWPTLTLAVAWALNSGLCAGLVPRWGLLGAAAARVTAEGAIVLLSGALLSRLLVVGWWRLLAPLALLAAAPAALWLLLPLSPGPRLAACLAAYAGAVALVRPLEPREWAMLRSFRRAPT
ncbi:MAG: lipopolysaccharide biosynthesis protein [Fimbriimonadaceae bacterium]|nr:lipopolysaccharide biosynthesis protein [Fimbriimonadaceae bacterium]